MEPYFFSPYVPSWHGHGKICNAYKWQQVHIIIWGFGSGVDEDSNTLGWVAV